MFVVGILANLESMVLVYCTTWLMRVIRVKTSCFDTDFAPKMKLANLPLFYCFVKLINDHSAQLSLLNRQQKMRWWKCLILRFQSISLTFIFRILWDSRLLWFWNFYNYKRLLISFNPCNSRWQIRHSKKKSVHTYIGYWCQQFQSGSWTPRLEVEFKAGV